MSLLDVRHLISQLNHVNLERISYDHLVHLFRTKTSGAIIPIHQSSPSEMYFRARISTEHINQISELGAPPPEIVTGFQRCNPPHVSMFYAASTRLTALLESGASVGDIVYLGQWINRTQLPINKILSSRDDTSLSLRQIDTLLQVYLETIFTRPISKVFADAYKLTAAATEYLTTNFPTTINEKLKSDGTVGLSYPSVTNIQNSYNTVFHRKFSIENMELLHVTKLKICSNNADNYSISIIDTANKFKDGFIQWNQLPHLIPLPNNDPKGVSMVFNGSIWSVPVYDSMPTDNQIHEFLNEFNKTPD